MPNKSEKEHSSTINITTAASALPKLLGLVSTDRLQKPPGNVSQMKKYRKPWCWDEQCSIRRKHIWPVNFLKEAFMDTSSRIEPPALLFRLDAPKRSQQIVLRYIILPQRLGLSSSNLHTTCRHVQIRTLRLVYPSSALHQDTSELNVTRGAIEMLPGCCSLNLPQPNISNLIVKPAETTQNDPGYGGRGNQDNLLLVYSDELEEFPSYLLCESGPSMAKGSIYVSPALVIMAMGWPSWAQKNSIYEGWNQTSA